jgi:hypothetical protein
MCDNLNTGELRFWARYLASLSRVLRPILFAIPLNGILGTIGIEVIGARSSQKLRCREEQGNQQE